MEISMIKNEFKKIFKSKKSRIVFIFLIVFAVADSILAAIECRRELASDLYAHPVYFTLIGGGRAYSVVSLIYYFMPVFLILSYCDKYIKELKNGIIPVYYTKIGRKKYFFSKTITAFLHPFMLCGIPYILNFAINSVIFHGGTDFSSMQTWPRDVLEERLYFSINHPYVIYFSFLLISLIVYGLLSVMCQSICFILKDNKLTYIVSLLIWIGIYFSNKNIAISLVLQPFVIFDWLPTIKAFFIFLPAVIIPLITACFCVIRKKDEI